MIRALTDIRALFTATVCALALAAPAAADTPTFNVMAGIGDSYTAGTLAYDPGDTVCPLCSANSWSAGNNPLVDSHFSRLRASSSPGLTSFNLAASGTKIATLATPDGQADDASDGGAQYVTVLIGLNDYCGQDLMPPTSSVAFRESIDDALGFLDSAQRVFLASVFDASRFKVIFAGDAGKLADVEGKCPNYDDPGARGWVDAYDAQLQAECAEHANCIFDGGAVSNWQYSAADITPAAGDHFHLSRTGQRDLAALTYPIAFKPVTPPVVPPALPRFVACLPKTANVITGTPRADGLTGTLRGDRIFAGAGNDTVDAQAGDDCIDLGGGNDLALGGNDKDRILGGAGRDRISGGPGNDSIGGDGNVDRISAGKGNDVAGGGPGNDTLLGGAGNDKLNGDSGNDALKGDAGRDRLTGRGGNDKINSRDGEKDRVSCGKGRDTVTADALDVVAKDCERVKLPRKKKQ